MRLKHSPPLQLNKQVSLKLHFSSLPPGPTMRAHHYSQWSNISHSILRVGAPSGPGPLRGAALVRAGLSLSV